MAETLDVAAQSQESPAKDGQDAPAKDGKEGLTDEPTNRPTKRRDKERVMENGELVVYSRRTERQKKKQLRQRKRGDALGLLDLPFELLTHILLLLRPSDLFRLARTSRDLHLFIADEERALARGIVRRRYPCLAKCFQLPARLDEIDPALRPALLDEDRWERMGIHKRPFQHVEPADPAAVCSCLTCVLRWNALCLAVDFAHWQRHLDAGEPIPPIPRGCAHPPWNRRLVASHAAVVRAALHRPLWHARILEAHLASTVAAIRRHSQNKGNRRRRFRMDEADERSGTDAFLERSGPPTLDFPFHRDTYYMLEAYLPNRSWNGEFKHWMYLPPDQHDKDLEFLARSWRSKQGAAAAT